MDSHIQSGPIKTAPLHCCDTANSYTDRPKRLHVFRKESSRKYSCIVHQCSELVYLSPNEKCRRFLLAYAACLLYLTPAAALGSPSHICTSACCHCDAFPLRRRDVHTLVHTFLHDLRQCRFWWNVCFWAIGNKNRMSCVLFGPICVCGIRALIGITCRSIARSQLTLNRLCQTDHVFIIHRTYKSSVVKYRPSSCQSTRSVTVPCKAISCH